MTTLDEYQTLTAQLLQAQEAGNEKEEDRLLDAMDHVWYRLSEEEIAILNAEAKERRKAYLKQQEPPA